MNQIEVLILLDIIELEDKEKFEKHVVKEGFEIVEGDDYVYKGKSSTSTFATKAYILEVFKKALQTTSFNVANLIFLLDDTPYPTYSYDKTTANFEEVKKEN